MKPDDEDKASPLHVGLACAALVIAIVAFVITVCNVNPKPTVIREKWEIRQQDGGMVEARKVSTEVLP